MTKSIWTYKTFPPSQKSFTLILSMCAYSFVCVFTFPHSSAFIVSTIVAPAFPQSACRGHCWHTLANRRKRAPIERRSNVPKSHTNRRTPFMERSHTRIFWFYLAALLPSHAPPCQPAAHTALQLWFYIPVRQNYSLVHNVSQIRRSQFLLWTQMVEGYELQREGVCGWGEGGGIIWGLNWLANVGVNWNTSCFMVQCALAMSFRQSNYLRWKLT